jgi:hypothetical protein
MEFTDSLKALPTLSERQDYLSKLSKDQLARAFAGSAAAIDRLAYQYSLSHSDLYYYYACKKCDIPIVGYEEYGYRKIDFESLRENIILHTLIQSEIDKRSDN